MSGRDDSIFLKYKYKIILEQALAMGLRLGQISDEATLEKMIDEVLVENPKELEQYRNGKTKLLGFFVGQMMKKTGGRCDPKLTNQLVAKKLNA